MQDPFEACRARLGRLIRVGREPILRLGASFTEDLILKIALAGRRLDDMEDDDASMEGSGAGCRVQERAAVYRVWPPWS